MVSLVVFIISSSWVHFSVRLCAYIFVNQLSISFSLPIFWTFTCLTYAQLKFFPALTRSLKCDVSKWEGSCLGRLHHCLTKILMKYRHPRQLPPTPKLNCLQISPPSLLPSPLETVCNQLLSTAHHSSCRAPPLTSPHLSQLKRTGQLLQMLRQSLHHLPPPPTCLAMCSLPWRRRVSLASP